MDDVAALLERHVANAASAWRHTKADTEAYRRLVVATDEWETYGTPTLTEDEADRMAAQMRRAARQALVSRDDEAIRLAHLVTVAAAAWLRATPATDAEAYDRLDRPSTSGTPTPPLARRRRRRAARPTRRRHRARLDQRGRRRDLRAVPPEPAPLRPRPGAPLAGRSRRGRAPSAFPSPGGRAYIGGGHMLRARRRLGSPAALRREHRTTPRHLSGEWRGTATQATAK